MGWLMKGRNKSVESQKDKKRYLAGLRSKEKSDYYTRETETDLGDSSAKNLLGEDGKRYGARGQGWQFRMAIPYQNPEKLNMASEILANIFFDTNLFFKSFTNNSANVKNWDATSTGAMDRDERGKEFCCYIRYESEAQAYEASTEFFKQMMLISWKRLSAADIKVGYTVPHGDRQILIEDENELPTPFSYTSNKPFWQRQGILYQNDFNPHQFNDPLKDMHITLVDLAEHDIPLSEVMRLQKDRVDYLKSHVSDLSKDMARSLNEIALRREDQAELIIAPVIEDSYKKISDLMDVVKEIETASAEEKIIKKQIVITTLEAWPYEVQLNSIMNTAPGNSASMEICEFEEAGTLITVLNKFKKGNFDNFTPDYTLDLISNLKSSITEEVENIITDFQTLSKREDMQSIAIQNHLNEWGFAEIDFKSLVLKNPKEMQLLYRKIVHHLHELDLFVRENDRLALMLNHNFVEAKKNTTIVDYAKMLVKNPNMNEMEILHLLKVRKNINEVQARQILDKVYENRIEDIYQKIIGFNKQVGVFGGEKIVHITPDKEGTRYTKELKVPAGVAEIAKTIHNGIAHDYPKSSVLDSVIKIAISYANKNHGALNKRLAAVAHFYTDIITPAKPRMMEIDSIPLKLITKGELKTIISNYHQRAEKASPHAQKGFLKSIFKQRTKGIKEIEDFLTTPGISELKDKQYLEGDALLKLLNILNERNDRIEGTSRGYENDPNKATNVAYRAIYEILEKGMAGLEPEKKAEMKQSPFYKTVKTCLAARNTHGAAKGRVNKEEDRMVAEPDLNPPSRKPNK